MWAWGVSGEKFGDGVRICLALYFSFFVFLFLQLCMYPANLNTIKEFNVFELAFIDTFGKIHSINTPEIHTSGTRI